MPHAFRRTLAHTQSLTLAAVALALASVLPACGRAAITFTLNPQPSHLEETSVIPPEGVVGTNRTGARVALIDVRGVILDSPQRGFLSPAINPVDELVARLEKAEHDPGVRAVVLRINSPGGGVAATETMYREVVRFRETTGKPVVVSMGEVAASGGYYLALAGDAIYAQESTITGSIGVIMPTINVSQGLASIGIVSRSITSGPNKDMANPLEPMRDGQYELLQEMVDEFYASFRERVLERRRAVLETRANAPAALWMAADPDAIRSSREYLLAHTDELTDGRIMTGLAAQRAGLVDSLGGVRDAFAQACKLAEIDAKNARLIKYFDSNDVYGPRSIYGQARAGDGSMATGGTGGAGGAGDTEINLVQLRLGDGSLAGLQVGSGAYYLWTMGGE